MYFSQRKLTIEALPSLRICPVGSIRPFALMMGPVYVYMERNEKFVSVKAPMDFFTAPELEKIASVQNVFLPSFVENLVYFRDVGIEIRRLMEYQDADTKMGLPPELLSFKVLEQLFQMWGKDFTIETYALLVFINEFSEIIPGEILRKARDEDIDRFELALLRAAMAAFLAFHLGYLNRTHLSQFRLETFQLSFSGQLLTSPSTELAWVRAKVFQVIESPSKESISAQDFCDKSSRASLKLAERFEQIRYSFGAPFRPLLNTNDWFTSDEVAS